MWSPESPSLPLLLSRCGGQVSCVLASALIHPALNHPFSQYTASPRGVPCGRGLRLPLSDSDRVVGPVPAVREPALSSPHPQIQRPCAPSNLAEKISLLGGFASVSSGRLLPLDLPSVQARPPGPSLHQQLASLNYTLPHLFFPPPVLTSRATEDWDPIGWTAPAAAALLCPAQALGNTGASASAPPIALTR